MPNWCNNQIKISGHGVPAIKEILEANPMGRMFELLVGKLADGQTESEYMDNWYDTNCDRWGCKWDVDIELDGISFDDDCIHMWIQTAWSPCNDFLRLLSDKYGVDVENIYIESGCDFAGMFVIEDGNESDECHTYLRGMYEFDYESFVFEIQNQLESMLYDQTPPALEEWLNEFGYVENKEDLIELYNEIV
jgi:hypothetical protein